MVFKRMYQASINQKSDIYAAALFTVDGLLVSAEIRWLHRSGSVPMSSVSGVEVGIDS